MKHYSQIYKINEKDGPTSVFIAKRSKPSLKQRFLRFKNNQKRKRIERTITCNNYHTIEEVLIFAVNECGLEELDRNSAEVQKDYEELRASFIIQYNPELLGDYAIMPRLKDETPEAIIEQMQRIKEQKQQALDVSKELFDVDVHVFVKKVPDEDDIMVKLHRYYGVTQADIDNRTRRYMNLVSALCK